MERPDSRSEHRQHLRFDDRVEGLRDVARAGLRLRRHVLRRTDLDARELKHDPEKCVAVFPRDKRGTRLRGDQAQTKR